MIGYFDARVGSVSALAAFATVAETAFTALAAGGGAADRVAAGGVTALAKTSRAGSTERLSAGARTSESVSALIAAACGYRRGVATFAIETCGGSATSIVSTSVTGGRSTTSVAAEAIPGNAG